MPRCFHLSLKASISFLSLPHYSCVLTLRPADATLAEKYARELCEIIIPTVRQPHHRAARLAIEKLLVVVARNTAFVRLFLTRLVRISDRYAQFPTRYASEALQLFRWESIILRVCPESKDTSLLSSLLQSQAVLCTLLVHHRPKEVASIVHSLTTIFVKDDALFSAYSEALLSSVSANNLSLIASASASIKAGDISLKVCYFEVFFFLDAFD